MSDRLALIAPAVEGALSLLPLRMTTHRARVALYTITLQEDPTQHRRQFGDGPARGLWQFEAGGGVKGVMNHPASSGLARAVCDDRGVPWSREMVWERLETDDTLAAAFARLLLFTDPMPLPDVQDADVLWAMYADRLWRPGKPHPEHWAGNHAEALQFVMENPAWNSQQV